MTNTDLIYQRMCEDILKNGYSDKDKKVRPVWPDDKSPAHTKKLFGVVNTYDLSKEFPILTIRKVPFKSCVDEILWIWQKKSNNVKDLNSHVWDSWADETGSIGKTYGYQLGVKHKYPEGEFDQVDRLLWLLKNNPEDRRMITNMYNHHDLHEMALPPCVYETLWVVTGDKLNLMLHQRSADIIVAGGWNVTQYAALLCMIAHVTGYKPGILKHEITNAHIYDRHESIANEFMSRVNSYSAPKVWINPEVKSFYDFTTDNIKLEGYEYEPYTEKIPVAV